MEQHGHRASTPYNDKNKDKDIDSDSDSDKSRTKISTNTNANTNTNNSVDPNPTSLPNQEPLSTSEPSLRFPRPVGNRYLANWISTSDPDIMHITFESTDDSGLAESTYELITGTDDSETWSQGGHDNDQECISESVSSLDPRRSDDVHSLADTEQLTDDEYTSVPPARASQATATTAGGISQGLTHLGRAAQIDSDDESEDGCASRSSLDYTQQSLGTPSMTTPEASRIMTQHGDKSMIKQWFQTIANETLHLCGWAKTIGEPVQRRLRHGWQEAAEFYTQPWAVPLAIIVAVSHYLIFALVLNSLGCQVYTPFGTSTWVSGAVTTTTTAATVITTTTPPAAPLLLTPERITTSSKSLATSSADTSLNLRDSSTSSDWFFAVKKPEISFSSPSHSSFLAQVPEDVMTSWASGNCVSFTAKRDGEQVKTAVTTRRDGLLMKFPRRNAHGSIDLVLEATCKPILHKVVKVRFGRSRWQEWAETAKHSIQGLMPVANRTLQDFKTALGQTIGSFARAADHHPLLRPARAVLNTARDSFWSFTRNSSATLQRTHVLDAMHIYRKRATHVVRGTQTSLQLGLLRAQIAAKLSWLAVLGKAKEHEEYQQKAWDYIKEKQARAQQDVVAGPVPATWLAWWKSMFSSSCSNVRWLNEKVAICE